VLEIRWSAEARHDLNTLIDWYLNEAGRDVACDAYLEIFSTLEMLRRFPQLGFSGKTAGTREIIVRRFPYRIVWTIEADKICIQTIIHSSRKYP
jgi:plasmid stabilization system protein ParE